MGLEKEDIMALIAILQKGLEDNDDTEPLKEKKKPVKQKRSRKKSVKQARENKFDTMSEKNMHKQDTLIDKKLWHNLSVSDRTRHYKPIQVQCRSCGKKENVNPMLVDSVERYKCNRCSSSPG